MAICQSTARPHAPACHRDLEPLLTTILDRPAAADLRLLETLEAIARRRGYPATAERAAAARRWIGGRRHV